VVVAILLPVFLVAALVTVVFAVGAVAFPLMPVARAYEGGESDTFDGLSRTVNYAFQSPLTWLAVNACAAAAFALFAAPLALLSREVPQGTALLPVAAALGFSAFWAVQSVGYTVLRRQMDAVGTSEVGWLDTDPGSLVPPDPPVGEEPPSEPAAVAPSATGRVVRTVVALALAVLAWVLLAECFAWTGADAAWLRPGAEGGPAGARWIATVWLVVVAVAALYPLVARPRLLAKADSGPNPDAPNS
jgi:hypothetical protein